MCGVDLSHSQPGAAGWFVQSFVLSCGLVVDRLVHMVILWWTPCSSCRAVHSASLKLSHGSLVQQVILVMAAIHLVVTSSGWGCLHSTRSHGCAWAAGQTDRVTKPPTHQQVTRSIQQHPHGNTLSAWQAGSIVCKTYLISWQCQPGGMEPCLMCVCVRTC